MVPTKAADEHRTVTRRDVARLAGVSSTTVTNVANGTGSVSEEMRQRVRAAIVELGYTAHPLARSLATRTSQQIGILVEGLGNPFHGELVTTVARRLNDLGLRSLIIEQTFANSEHLTTLFGGLVDGLIVANGLSVLTGEALGVLVTGPIPVIAQGLEVDVGLPTVNPGFGQGVYRVVRHLEALGHRRVAFIGESRPASSSQRHMWYCTWVDELGLDREDGLVFQTAPEDPWSEEAGYRAAQGLLASSCGATAVFAASDALAIGAMKAFADAGVVVPRDMSVVGWDDLPHSQYVSPGLTTVRVDRVALGSRLVDGLLQRMHGNAADTTPLQCELMVRGTTGRPQT